jgi:hypothetical protein
MLFLTDHHAMNAYWGSGGMLKICNYKWLSEHEEMVFACFPEFQQTQYTVSQSEILQLDQYLYADVL